MNDVQITSDAIVYWGSGPFKLNATIVNTWITMIVLVLIAWLVRRGISSRLPIPKLQHLLEVVVEFLTNQIRDISQKSAAQFLPFIGTLFLLIAMANLLGIVPGFRPPTASLSTTVALATCVFFAVPYFGIRNIGFRQYVGQYFQPTLLMLPFNIIGELSRTVALAVRLYGNMMSGSLIAGVLLLFVPLFVPIVMHVLGLITGMIQAYIFAILAMVYIASASAARKQSSKSEEVDLPNELTEQPDRPETNDPHSIYEQGATANG